MTMEPIGTEQRLRERMGASALLVLFGGAHCGVCQAIRPRIERMVAQSFPQVAMAYVDCAEAPAVCAQHGVFSLHEVGAEMERLLVLWGRQDSAV